MHHINVHILLKILLKLIELFWLNLFLKLSKLFHQKRTYQAKFESDFRQGIFHILEQFIQTCDCICA